MAFGFRSAIPDRHCGQKACLSETLIRETKPHTWQRVMPSRAAVIGMTAVSVAISGQSSPERFWFKVRASCGEKEDNASIAP